MIAAVKEWAFALFMTAMAGGIATFIAPDNPKMKKYVKLAVTVCAAAVLIMPLKNIITAQFDFGAAETVSYDYAEGIAERKVEEIMCDEINAQIYDEFGFYADKVYFDGDTLVLESPQDIGGFVRSIYYGKVLILS